MVQTVWFENSHYEKLRSLQEMCSSQPVIRLYPVFAPMTWASDSFIMFQNGIRSQLIDVFAMVNEMASQFDTITRPQCTALRKSITEVGHMVALYFHIQERVILPELNVFQPGSCSIPALREVTFPLIKMLIRIHASTFRLERASRRDDYGFTSQGDDAYESFRQTTELIFAFVVECEKRFSQEITNLASILMKAKKAGAKELLRQCVHELLSFKEGEHTFPGYSANLPSDVRNYCLTGLDVLKLRKIKSSERRWCRDHRLRRKQVMVDNHRPRRRSFRNVF